MTSATISITSHPSRTIPSGAVREWRKSGARFMPMTPFVTRFPELGARETRALLVSGRKELPDGNYGFLELYCDEPGCDCRRVMIDLLREDTEGQHLGHSQLWLGECRVLPAMGALLQRSGGTRAAGARTRSAESANPVLASSSRELSDLLITVPRLRAAPQASLPDVSRRGAARTAASSQNTLS